MGAGKDGERLIAHQRPNERLSHPDSPLLPLLGVTGSCDGLDYRMSLDSTSCAKWWTSMRLRTQRGRLGHRRTWVAKHKDIEIMDEIKRHLVCRGRRFQDHCRASESRTWLCHLPLESADVYAARNSGSWVHVNELRAHRRVQPFRTTFPQVEICLHWPFLVTRETHC